MGIGEGEGDCTGWMRVRVNVTLRCHEDASPWRAVSPVLIIIVSNKLPGYMFVLQWFSGSIDYY